jgi:hypothetical protein
MLMGLIVMSTTHSLRFRHDRPRLRQSDGPARLVEGAQEFLRILPSPSQTQSEEPIDVDL